MLEGSPMNHNPEVIRAIMLEGSPMNHNPR